MNIVEITALITAIAALVTAIIGIWQNVLTRIILENTSRPYITVYNEVLYINQPTEYIVIKNAGFSPAVIKNIIYDESKLNLMSYTAYFDTKDKNRNNIKQKDTVNANTIINSFKDSTLAPNQIYRIPIDNTKTKFEQIDFSITYGGATKRIYKEQYTLNLRRNLEMAYIKANGANAVSDTLQEILNKM